MMARRCRWAGALCLAACFITSCTSADGTRTAEAAVPPASESGAPRDAVDELHVALADLGVQMPAEQTPASTQYVNAFGEEFSVLGEPLTIDDERVPLDLNAEVLMLRDRINDLEETMFYYMDTIVGELRAENGYLRDELARVYQAQPGGDRNRPIVPRPGTDVLEAVRDYGTDNMPRYNQSMDAAPSRAAKAPAHTVVNQWGRTQEQAAELGPQVSSLCGLIGTVAPGVSDDELLELGHQLRREYDAYRNINIDIFDNVEAAEAYAAQNTKSTMHHVLTVARHPQTGIDQVVVYRNGRIVRTVNSGK